MSIHATITQYARMLNNLDAWLQAAVPYAEDKQFDPEVFAQPRLAPDQYALVQQVQSACDAAKYAAAYLSGQTAPSHPDTEKTVAELRARVAKARSYGAGCQEADFAGAGERRVAPAWMQGKSVGGDAYLTRIATPNFYFHVTMSYAILRHNGVSLGKADFIGVKGWEEIGDW